MPQGYFGKGRDIDKEVEDAEKGTPKKADPCAALAAKVARQPAGSARRAAAERQLANCRANARQSTDGAN